MRMLTLLRYLLFPLGALYWMVTTLRNSMYDTGLIRSYSFSTPIICVGNLSAGGTGKTPMTEYLIRLLQNDHRVVVLSRGYGRESKGYHLVSTLDTAQVAGDEPLQIKRKFNEVQVVVCEDRVKAIKRIENELKADLIIMDDGFQHRRVRPLLSILLTEYHRPFYRDHILPVGRLRESRSGVKRADAIMYTKCPASPKSLRKFTQPSFYSSILYDPLDDVRPIFGFSGLAQNDIFKAHLQEQGRLAGFKGYPDHHLYTAQDIKELTTLAGDAVLCCTEKDWVKVESLAAPIDIQVIGITNEITPRHEFDNWILDRLKHES